MSFKLADRVAVFVDAGELEHIPTRWQVLQGELEMWPTVLSTDVTDEDRYAGAPLAHPWLRQPIILNQIGLDHLRIGTGLGARIDSVCTHLHFTFHRGMPVWDLQVVQTHPGGLDTLQRRTDDLLAARTRETQRALRRLRWILPEPERYLGRFLGPDGWIERAAALDYPTAAEDGGGIPEEFHSLTAFLAYCAESFPADPSALPRHRWPGRLAWHASRRFREGRGFGWFSALPTQAHP